MRTYTQEHKYPQRLELSDALELGLQPVASCLIYVGLGNQIQFLRKSRMCS